MSVGRTFQDQQHTYVDRSSGREIVQLTRYLGHSYQFYFTHPCWLEGGQSFIFNSERENHNDFFRYDLETGLITQLTDSASQRIAGGCLSTATSCLYYWIESGLYELELDSLEERLVCEVPSGVQPGRPAATADGRHLCVLWVEGKGSDADKRPGPARDGGSAELFERQPLSQVVRIEVGSGQIDVLHEDRRYISHVNTSPTRADLLTFATKVLGNGWISVSGV